MFSLVSDKRPESAALNVKLSELDAGENNWLTLHLPNGDAVALSISGTYPMFHFTNSTDGERTNGIYLFIGEVYKLLKYMNTRFSLSDQDNFKVGGISLTNDDFF